MIWNISLGGGFNSVAAVFTISHKPSCKIQGKKEKYSSVSNPWIEHVPFVAGFDFTRFPTLLFNLPVPPSCMCRQKMQTIEFAIPAFAGTICPRGTFFSQQAVLLAQPEEGTLFPRMPLALAGRALREVFLNSILFPRSFLDNVYSSIIWVHGSLAAGRPIYKLSGEVEENVIHEHKAPPRWTKGCIPSSWYKAELTPVISEW